MSTLLAALYLQGGFGYLLPAPQHLNWGRSHYDRPAEHNPYGTIAIGLETPPRKWQFSVEFRHTSSIPVNDWGDNGVWVQLKVKP